jgi:hypothetical protein
VYVISKRLVKKLMWSYRDAVPHQMVAGTIGRNEMDNHVDTYYAGANWRLLDTTNKVCKVTPFLRFL